jgi:hypothetical protein
MTASTKEPEIIYAFEDYPDRLSLFELSMIPIIDGSAIGGLFKIVKVNRGSF